MYLNLAKFGYNYIPETLLEKCFKQKNIPRMLSHTDQLGVLKSIAVDQNYQGNGIGTILSKDAINSFKERGVTTIFTIAWKSEKGVNLGGILKLLEFDYLYECLDYWKDESIEDSFDDDVILLESSRVID